VSAGDGRTFALAVQDAGRNGTEFDEFRLSRSGQPSALTLLPVAVQAKNVITGLALSPDGGTLAIVTRSGDGVQQIVLHPLHGKVPRAWTASGGTIGAAFDTRSLSWTTDQHTLAFDWYSAGKMSVRLLGTGAAQGSLLAASRPVLTLGNVAPTGPASYVCPGNSVITPDGSAIVCAASQITSLARDKSIGYSTGFAEFSAATGHVTRILAHWARGQSTGPRVMDVLWSDPSGRVLIGAIRSAGRLWVGVISGNEFTPLDIQVDPAAPDLGTW
jgi:hypothetical protein